MYSAAAMIARTHDGSETGFRSLPDSRHAAKRRSRHRENATDPRQTRISPAACPSAGDALAP
ncbi:hypothetical protein, partial [Burkholderia ubonensis]|uniref:hypothetical protein n=1 Tax=Burkholderia ubonensis TaxID=101571 RepID=UPI001C4355BA